MTVPRISRHAAVRVLPIALVSCGAGLPSTIGAEPDASVSVATEGRRWTTERQAFAGPVLDPSWFAKRRVVVYLMPEEGDLVSIRRAAALIMRDRWLEGDWSLKHVVVSDVGKFRFVARQRLAVHEIALPKRPGRNRSSPPRMKITCGRTCFFSTTPIAMSGASCSASRRTVARPQSSCSTTAATWYGP